MLSMMFNDITIRNANKFMNVPIQNGKANELVARYVIGVTISAATLPSLPKQAHILYHF